MLFILNSWFCVAYTLVRLLPLPNFPDVTQLIVCIFAVTCGNAINFDTLHRLLSRRGYPYVCPPYISSVCTSRIHSSAPWFSDLFIPFLQSFNRKTLLENFRIWLCLLVFVTESIHLISSLFFNMFYVSVSFPFLLLRCLLRFFCRGQFIRYLVTFTWFFFNWYIIVCSLEKFRPPLHIKSIGTKKEIRHHRVMVNT